MTDRLATLMRGEAETLDVPAAPTREILDAGHRLRRRRTLGRGAAGVSLLAVAATTVAVVTLGGGHPTDARPTAPVGSAPHVSWAVDDTVYVGSDATPVAMPEVAQTLYYTSAGLLVRTNKDGSSDGGAPFHFELVRADGTATKLGVTLGEVVPSTDPTEPYLAWATMSGDRIQVVVHDVATDRDVATVDVPGTFDWGGWEAPPVSLSGDQVYVGTNHTTAVVNWRTGAATTTDVVPGSTMPTVDGGRTVVQGIDSTLVVDTETGKTLLDISAASGGNVTLSPDGGFAMVATRRGTDLYAVDTGGKVQVPATGWAWAPDGSEVFRVHDSTLERCGTGSGECHDSPIPALGKNAFVRYPGISFES